MNGVNDTSMSESWKGHATRRDLIRYHRMKDFLLIKLPWYQVPIEAGVLDVINQGNYAKLSLQGIGYQWVERKHIEVISILPPRFKPVVDLTSSPWKFNGEAAT